jgi:hypothetical protein
LRTSVRLVVLCGLVLSLGCSGNPVDARPTVENTGGPSLQTPSPSVTISPPEGNAQMTPAQPIPAEPGLQNLIETAKADLAQRLAVSPSEILLLEAVSVTWPDASLGCPREGMVYAQVLTPGYLIRLQTGERMFEYHASSGTEVIYCANPTPPIPGTPADI